MKALQRLTVRLHLPEPLQDLLDLARNLRWSWHQPTRQLFDSLHPQLRLAEVQDPLALLAGLSQQDLLRLADDAELVQKVKAAGAELRDYLQQPRWYQRHYAATAAGAHPASDAAVGPSGDAAATAAATAPAAIAYFSPEYGITSALPQYSGGLGILAGDHLKAASDLGVPLIGVGLFYHCGYFSQSLNREGWQQESYPVLNPQSLALQQLCDAQGEAVQISLPLPNERTLNAIVWVAQVGRVPLLLLDTNIPANDEAGRAITERLYGGDGEYRLLQEILLGVGGVRALRAYTRIHQLPEATVYHSNEGHAGFSGVERMRELMASAPEGEGLDFAAALARVRAGTVFTTHTPVPAGIDRFPQELVDYIFAAGVCDPVPLEQLLQLGAENYAGGNAEVFNMAVMGLRLAARANGVSALHREVSRTMFQPLWPGFAASEVPITSVTNGVHHPTWMAEKILEFARETLGDEAVDGADFAAIDQLPDADLWQLKKLLRADLVADARRRLHQSETARRGPAYAGWTEHALDEQVLTIGFARRVPTYKRLTLMLRDEQRLRRLLTNEHTPVQIVVAGKSHPHDEQGKEMIQQLVRFSEDEQLRHRIVFLPDYDMDMARTLFPGCDVWLNNPLRPFEACGTSGMKAAVNGGLNLSILDGWWDEMFDGGNGWAIPTASSGVSEEERDDAEAHALYELIEKKLIPLFYGSEFGRPAAGEAGRVPSQWVEMIKHTVKTLGPKVSAWRMVRDYVQQLYAPAGAAAAAFTAPGAAESFAAFRQRAEASFPLLRCVAVETSVAGQPLQQSLQAAGSAGAIVAAGQRLQVECTLDLGQLGPDEVQVQAVLGRVNGSDDTLHQPVPYPLEFAGQAGDYHRFTAELPLELSGEFGVGLRVLPQHELMANPAELQLVHHIR